MTLNELDSYINSILKKENYGADPQRTEFKSRIPRPTKSKSKKSRSPLTQAWTP